ncbi:MAG: SDR family oxidoreductase [Sphaerochaetaceae bacterium]|jgi:NAD(P)-dependent dehydrogenase (short-subunit alcohol dehydrogenase family)
MDYKLTNKVVLITGSTGGIGKALTRAFAREGSRLAISSTKQEKLDAFIPTLGLSPDRIKGFVADVTKEEDVKRFVEQAAAHYGTIDVMVITAGTEGENKQIVDSTLEDYQKVYAVNVFAPMFCIKYAAREMLKRKSGAIVTIASNGSFTTAPGMGAYCSSKHAVAGLVKTAAMELGPQGIHCNYICPGAVETPMIHRIEKSTLGPSANPEESEKLFASAYLDKRYCKPEEVADLALFLASDVSAHLMGSGIRLDGGLDAQSR